MDCVYSKNLETGVVVVLPKSLRVAPTAHDVRAHLAVRREYNVSSSSAVERDKQENQPSHRESCSLSFLLHGERERERVTTVFGGGSHMAAVLPLPLKKDSSAGNT